MENNLKLFSRASEHFEKSRETLNSEKLASQLAPLFISLISVPSCGFFRIFTALVWHFLNELSEYHMIRVTTSWRS